MSEDTFGEELAPDATIWKLYVEEATEQDQELAALFSAILTAFLVEAKKLLEEDPAATSATLLLLITQSQQRIELGTPDTSLKVTTSTPFQSTTIARYVNGLWFTALALSLAAALIAMLAKEWLAGFVSSTVRPPYDFTLQRQAKYNGLLSWRALYIIALLPSLLHLSLLLFALGLVLYLWSLDKAIAVLIGAVAGMTLLLYVITAILGAVFESCPFVTYISAYIRAMCHACFGNRGMFKNGLNSPKLFHHDGVPGEALQALGWLASNSRDPTVANSAYQALAAYIGLSQSPICNPITLDSTDPTTKLNPANQIHPICRVPSHLEVSTNSEFLHDVCRQFRETVLHKHREVAACLGSNLARYAVALPPLATHIEGFRELELSKAGAQSQNQWSNGQVSTLYVLESPLNLTIPHMSNQSCFELAFATLDLVWNNDCAPLSPDAYAMLTAAELRLTASVVVHEAHNPYYANFPSNASPQSQIPAQHTALNFGVLDPSFSLSRSSRTLARASVLLHYHLTDRAPMSGSVLVHLLHAVSSVVECERVIFGSDLEVKVNVVGNRTEHCPNENKLGDPNGIFKRLLAIWDMESMPGTWSRSEGAAARAVSSFAYHFLKEWIGRNEIQGPQTRSRSSSYRGIDFELPITLQEETDKDAFYLALESWPDDQQLHEARRPLPSVLSRLLVISAVSLCQIERQAGSAEFPVLILRALYRSAEALSGKRQLYTVLTKNKALVGRLVELVENNADAIKPLDHELSVFVYLARFLSLPFEKRTMLYYCGLRPQQLVLFLRILGRTSDLPFETELLLYDIFQLLEDRPGTYTPLFAELDTAFSALLDIGRHDTYTAAVTNTLQRILQCLSSMATQAQSIRLMLPGLRGILAAINFVIENQVSNEEPTHISHPVSEVLGFLQTNVEGVLWDELAGYLETLHSEEPEEVYGTVDAIISLSLSQLWEAAGLPRLKESSQNLK
ncbi:hypothetical protein FRC09_012684 [Ceratobasidium sp. 395]|nr:hypothetical protein FRC09_012684 [Ceratobasidium sp. 395]